MRVVALLSTVVIASAGSAAPPAGNGHGDDPAAVQRGREGSTMTGTVVADTFWSQALGTRKRALVWLPPSYWSSPGRRYPVAYYLHGAEGDETNWSVRGSLDRTLDSLTAAGVPEMIVVMPDGDDGFYTTWNWLGDYGACQRNRPQGAEPASSYCVPWPHYDDYIARDLVARVDGRFRTVADRRHRGIAGLSMGGFGAVALALAYPDVFSAAASHSGLVAPAAGMREAPAAASGFQLDAIESSYAPWLWRLVAPVFGKDSTAWAARDPATLAARLRSRRPTMLPALMVDCGLGDPFLVQNRAFRERLNALMIPVEYFEHAGEHAWDYWRRRGAESAAWLAAKLSGA